MNNNEVKPKVLIISSLSPFKGPGSVAWTKYNSLINNGYEVDFLTKYKVPERPDLLYIYKYNPRELNRLFWLINGLFKRIRIPIINQKRGHSFFYRKETTPPVPVSFILRKVVKQYDIIYVFFWQELLSYYTIERLNKIQKKCLWIFSCVDYSTMSGGCHFTRDCKKFISGCGKCPAIYSNRQNDFTEFNIQYRKKVLEEIKPILTMNKYMYDYFYNKSYLFRGYQRIEKFIGATDIDFFKPMDICQIRNKYHILDRYSFIILFGSQNIANTDKGVDYILKALNIFHHTLSECERDSVLVVTVGNSHDIIKKDIPFDNFGFGYVSLKELPEIYNLANVYLSASVYDAGPSMVRQSISCGTPVVSFEIGSAIDIIKDRPTGYCAKLCDESDFAAGIEYIHNLSPEDYDGMRCQCRNIAVQLLNNKTSADKTQYIWDKYRLENRSSI